MSGDRPRPRGKTSFTKSGEKNQRGTSFSGVHLRTPRTTPDTGLVHVSYLPFTPRTPSVELRPRPFRLTRGGINSTESCSLVTTTEVVLFSSTKTDLPVVDGKDVLACSQKGPSTPVQRLRLPRTETRVHDKVRVPPPLSSPSRRDESGSVDILFCVVSVRKSVILGDRGPLMVLWGFTSPSPGVSMQGTGPSPGNTHRSLRRVVSVGPRVRLNVTSRTCDG